jgi:hypothetical protein
LAKDIRRHAINRNEEGEMILLPGTCLYVHDVYYDWSNILIVQLGDCTPPELLTAQSFRNASMPEEPKIPVWSEEKLLDFIREQRHSKNEISLQNDKMNEFNIAILANEFTKGIGWLRLNLWENHMGPRCASHISRILQLSTLTYLHLGKNCLGSKGMQYLNGLENHATLIELDLWENNIGDEGIEHLARFLPSTKLVEINLGNNKITDHTCERLFSSLPRTMKRLNLFSNVITPTSNNIIIDAILSTDPKLEELNIGGTNPIWSVSQDLLKEIANANKCNLEPKKYT